MKKNNRLFALIIALMMAVTMLAMPAMGEDTTDDPVAVTVNGVEIKQSELDALTDEWLYYFYYYGNDITDEAVIEQAGSNAMQSLIYYEIMRQKAIELNIVLTDDEKAECVATWEEEIQAYADSLITSETPTEEETGQALADALAAAEEQGYTVELLQENAISEKLLEYIQQDVVVTDEDIQALYDSCVAEDDELYGGEDGYSYYEFVKTYGYYYGYSDPMYVPEGIRGITHILLEVDENLLSEYQDMQARLEESQDEEEKAAEDETAAAEEAAEPVTQLELDEKKAEIIASVQSTVDEIMEKFNAGTPFAQLVEEYGTDPGMAEEPYKSTGYEVHLDSTMLDSAFVVGAFNELENIGDVSGPVVGAYGVHILYYNCDIPSGPVALTDELKDELESEALETKQSDVLEAAYEQWKAEADIVYAE